jgi:hypothetical protein
MGRQVHRALPGVYCLKKPIKLHALGTAAAQHRLTTPEHMTKHRQPG